MKQTYQKLLGGFMLAFAVCSFQFANAQLNTPRGSQMAKTMQRVGITDIYVKYSRPQVNDREIWGNLVPYGMNNLGFGTAKESPWRAGANENTTITFNDAVTVGGKKVPAGTYGYHLIVNEDDTATVILSSDSGSWGSYFYDPANDVARVDIKTETVPHREFLTFEFTEVNPNDATLALIWEKKAFPLKIEVDVKDIVLADIREKLTNSPGFNRQSWEQAAQYALNNGGDLNEALAWVDAAIAGQFFSQKTFNNLGIKAQILMKQGKKEEAFAMMDEAREMGTVLQVHQMGRQLIALDQKQKALEVFKFNAKKNKDTWPVHYGMARGLSAIGKHKEALKHLKIALNNAPNKPNKDAIVAGIAKLEKGEDIN
ncbi:DUF2911 domain-containing protein [Sungkyunkwania multivorans]|uniref:DUF2911 domain-containing protein n=1 Tax=Sungkyunkwania multivorans TaxID=1173618 RepID=A0ABW3CWD8_9FLAO